jgi:hypothetical protein
MNVKFDTYAACETLARTLQNKRGDNKPCLIMAVDGEKDGEMLEFFGGTGLHQIAFFETMAQNVIKRIDSKRKFPKSVVVELLKKIIDNAADKYYGDK